MGVCRIDHNLGRRLAESSFAILPIYATPTGAKLALLKQRVGLLDPMCQFTVLLQFPIGGIPSLSWFSRCIKRPVRQKQRASQDDRALYEISPRQLHKVKPRILNIPYVGAISPVL